MCVRDLESVSSVTHVVDPFQVPSEDQDSRLHPLDRSSFDKYSGYIKNFLWLGDISYTTLNSMVAALSLDRPWLPSLRTFTDHSVTLGLPLMVFGASTLQHLEIQLCESSCQWFVALFEELPSLCPMLQSLSLEHIPLTPPAEDVFDFLEEEDYDDAFSDFLWTTIVSPGALNLCVVSTDEPISWEDVVALATLPRIKHAKFRLKIEEWSTFDLTRDISGAFPRLEILDIVCSLCEPILRLFDHIVSEDLFSITITTPRRTYTPTTAVVERLLKSIAIGPFCNSVNGVHLDTSTSNPNGSQHDYTITMSTLRPLLSVPNIDFLHVEFPWIILTKDDIHTLASTWPWLRNIFIRQSRTSAYAVDVEWITIIAERCKDLRRIGLDVRAGAHLSPRIPALLAHASHIANESVGTLCCNVVNGTSDAVETGVSNRLSRVFADVYLWSLFPAANFRRNASWGMRRRPRSQ